MNTPKTKWTAGKWIAAKVSLPYVAWEILDSTKRRGGIARLPATRPEDEANAQLIALSPELAEALRRLLDSAESAASWLRDCAPGTDQRERGDDLQDHAQQARSVLAKLPK